jgi:urease accessory protein
MRALAELVVGPSPSERRGFRVERMVSQAPVAWRPTPEAVYMIGTSAFPVGDDRVDVVATVRAGAQLSIRSAAAAIAWSGQGSGCHISIDVEEGGELNWLPEPLVATAGCDHDQRATVRLAAGARLRWREILVLGRAGEAAGCLCVRLSVDRAGRPLLRHEISTAVAAVWTSPAVMGANRVAGMVLTVDDSAPEPESAAGEGWAVMPLYAGGVLTLAVGPDVPTVSARLGASITLEPTKPG